MKDSENKGLYLFVAIVVGVLVCLISSEARENKSCTKINDDVKRCTLPNGDICYMWNDGHHGSGMSCKFKDK